METGHIQPERVKEYLLGTLPPDLAAALEERYFVDRSFFLRVQRTETRLIEEYLEGRLPAEEVALFESVYLAEPGLSAKVEQARRHRETVREHSSRRWLHPAIVAAAAALVVVTVVGVRWYRMQQPATVITARGTQPPIVVQLTPGVEMSSSRAMPEVRPGNTSAEVRLAMEIPGLKTPSLYHVKVSVIGKEGGLATVWQSSQPVRSHPEGSGQKLEVVLPLVKLPPGDYIVAAEGADSSLTGEKYLFRVVESR